MLASIVIRTYNEERYLTELLEKLRSQDCRLTDMEIVVVDSGSTDATLEIANRHDCLVTNIRKEDFTFGRSLNVGCDFAHGDILVFISGHCIPVENYWLDELVKPLVDDTAVYSYGRQIGRDTTKFSEKLHFEKYFPTYSKLPQEGFFCNNANAALQRKIWEKFKFNEELTGLEDMYLAKQIVNSGEKIAYNANASVYHIHDESWEQVIVRYEREAYALQRIMPEVHFRLHDFLWYLLSGVVSDSREALRQGVFTKKVAEIIAFRFAHYWGTYKGNHEHRKLSADMKYGYFYPKDLEKEKYET